jgi:DnaK suppressor protein
MHRARRQLETERQQALRRLAALTGDFDAVVEASRDSNADDEHDPEGATIAFERSQVAALVLQVRGHLAEVEAALERLEVGSYGICERCGQPIAQARLEARPAASRCIRCARVVTDASGSSSR